MTAHTLNQRDIDFLLYEFLDTEGLLERPRYSDHSRESFDATISGVRDIAANLYANHYQAVKTRYEQSIELHLEIQV